jgi:hypothetical protein
VAEDVNNRVRRIQNVGVIGQICRRQDGTEVAQGSTASLPWMVMKVVSMMAVRDGAVAPSFLYRYYPSHVESNNSLWDQRQRGVSKSNGGWEGLRLLK